LSETRFEATYRVTGAAAAWLWDKGVRIMAPEVGLARGGLCMPQNGRWRVDLVGIDSQVHVIEVKGTRADIKREDLAGGKWALPYYNLGLCPWLAVDAKVTNDLFADLPDSWGVIRVSGTRVKILREPAKKPLGKDMTRSLQAVAAVNTTQNLPMLMGLSKAQKASAMAYRTACPWHLWYERGRYMRFEGQGNIL
jgi:hypothetical protein